MAEKKKRATDQLNVALAGIDSVITVVLSGNADEPTKKLLRKAREFCDEAQGHLVMIKAHLDAL